MRILFENAQITYDYTYRLCDFIMCSGNLVNVDTYKDIEELDSGLFIEGLDIEFCFNARKHSYIIINAYWRYQLAK